MDTNEPLKSQVCRVSILKILKVTGSHNIGGSNITGSLILEIQMLYGSLILEIKKVEDG